MHLRRYDMPGRRRTALRLLLLLRERRLRLVAILLLGVIGSLASLVAPWLIGSLIDRLVGPGQVQYTGFLRLLLLLALAYGIAALFHWLVVNEAQRLSQDLVTGLRRRLFDHVTRLELAVLDRHSRGDIVSRMTNDSDAVGEGVRQALVQLVSGLMILSGSLLLMLRTSVWISLLMLALMPLNFVITRFIAKRSHERFRDQAEMTGRVNALGEEAIELRRLIQASGAATAFDRRFDDINRRLYDAGQKAQFYSSLTNPGTRFVNNVAYAAVGLVSALTTLAGGLTIGQMTRLLNYTLQFAKPVNELSAVFAQLQNAFASGERIFEILDIPAEVIDPTLPDLELEEGSVSFRDVSFTYDPDRPLIRHLNLEVPGEGTIAIVGPTGAGKTTLVNLLMRFYDVSDGEIRIDGQPIGSVSRRSLRGAIGMVLQDSWLFEGTIRENIAYGRPEASLAEVQEAARAARADRFIRQLPEGYDTAVGNGAALLSSGQLQLLAVARVMLLRPPLLILDEATSHIDTMTEQLVQRSFLALMEGRTSFIIAHRLSTVRAADQILVMDDGDIVEQGTHDELLAAGGLYRRLHDSQFET
ncbi:MAG: ABC transporter ATP-binding protein [Bacillota bacterium]|nr:ABC transporter ATP-binding protein [Bacillota bacterium]